jgi:hypothetical protein
MSLRQSISEIEMPTTRVHMATPIVVIEVAANFGQQAGRSRQ